MVLMLMKINRMKNNRNSENRRKLIKGLVALPLIGGISCISPAPPASSGDQGYLTDDDNTALQRLNSGEHDN